MSLGINVTIMIAARCVLERNKICAGDLGVKNSKMRASKLVFMPGLAGKPFVIKEAGGMQSIPQPSLNPLLFSLIFSLSLSGSLQCNMH